MAEQPDKDSKTEEPSEKKISDALEKGNVPRSREMSIFASLLGILLVLAFCAGPGAANLSNLMAMLIDHPAQFSLASGTDATGFLYELSLRVGVFLLPIIAILALAGIASSFLQHAPRLALEQVRPKWSRVSPAAGWKRLFGSSGQIEFLKAMGKFIAVGIVVAIILDSDRDRIVRAMAHDPGALPDLILGLAVKLVSVVGVAILLLVAGDVVWSRLKWRSDLRMTRQEVKDELKQSEGDPLVRARLRSLARDRARRRMIAAVPKATLVVANPTHFAVALRYERGKDGAPQVVAKGADLVALRIREIAAAHGIPVFEDKPLARALYAAVEVDQWIPPEFYRAVARLLYLLYSRRNHAPAV